jgi:hypothetical protein
MSTFTKAEREGLEEIFITLSERKRFLDRVKSSRKEMFKILKHLFKSSKKNSKFNSHLSV